MDYAAERLGGKCGLQMDLEFWHMALAQPKGVPELWQTYVYLVLPDRTVSMHYFIMHCHPLDVKFNIIETSAILKKRLGFQVSDHSIPFLILDDFWKKSHEIIGQG